MKTTIFAAAAALFSSALALSAHDYKIGDLVIEHPTSFETPKGARAGVGYLVITNAGTTPDTLIEARAGFPRVEIHTTVEEGGIARMRHVEAIEIAPGETVALQPGGYHIMFMGLGGDPFEVGEKIPATLIFEQAGAIEIEFDVRARGEISDASMDHGKMGHGSTEGGSMKHGDAAHGDHSSTD